MRRSSRTCSRRKPRSPRRTTSTGSEPPKRPNHGGLDVRQNSGAGRGHHNGSARRRVRNALMVTLALAGVAACARTSVENVNVRAVGLPKPQLIVVHDFGVTPGDVALDSAIGARLTQMAQSTPASEQEVKVGREVARIVRESLVKEISKLGIPAVSAATATPVVGPSLSIEGQFLSVDEGNRLRRMVVGFGAGASEVRTVGQVYEMTRAGRIRRADFYTTVKSSIKPGMGPMAGVGAAAGRAATSAMVSGGVGIATERSQGVDGDAKHTAEEITKTLKKFFVEQGWITPQCHSESSTVMSSGPAMKTNF